MTAELNEQVALRCGWKRETRKRYAGSPNVKGWGFNAHLSLGHPDRVFTTHQSSFPPYTTSLDAIHAAEATMTVEQCDAFRIALITGADDRNIKNPADLYMWHASARQRCIAFLAATEPAEPARSDAGSAG